MVLIKIETLRRDFLKKWTPKPFPNMIDFFIILKVFKKKEEALILDYLMKTEKNKLKML